MKTTGLAVALVALCVSCHSPSNKCLQVGTVDKTGVSVSPPARVSIFFAVQNCDGDTPVTNLVLPDNFKIYEDGHPVSVFESQAAILPKGQQFRAMTALVLDTSGSIVRSGSIHALITAANAFAQQLTSIGPEQSVAVFTFDGRKTLQQVVPFTTSLGDLAKGINGLNVKQCTSNADCAGRTDATTCALTPEKDIGLCIDDSTNLNGAVVQSLTALDDQRAAAKDVKFTSGAMVLLTDGTDEAGWTTSGAALTAAQETKNSIFTIGLGGEVSADILKQLGRTGYYPVDQASNLQAAFDQISDRLRGQANQFYLVEYCSPARSGKHQLTLTATTKIGNDTITGSFSQQFDAGGFTSGCSVP